MQKKSNFLTKIVKKDYNNKLEEVLSKKSFDEEVKNLLLSMFYKIENGYKDYKEVKRETFDKKEYIEKLINIIDKDCNEITFIPMNTEDKEVVDSKNKVIKCLPIENKILYCLAKIQKRNIVVKYIDKNIEEAFSTMLNIGNNINIVEPLRDFNGFSWNIITKDIEDINYNLLYQNMIFLINNKFVDKWVNNYEPLVDYFDLFQSEIEKRYGKKAASSITKNLVRISLKLMARNNEEFKEKIEEKSQKIEEEKVDITSKINESNNKPIINKNDILVEGLDDIKVNLSGCCKPIPGDKIIGYITKGSGITVHRAICQNIADLGERLVSVKWNNDLSKKYFTDLIIHTNTSDNLLDIITKASLNNITIDSISTINKSEYKVYSLTVLVENTEKLNKFITDLTNLPFTLKVERLLK